jgi:predicted RNase H-like nuclease (RuvC/YqgF family)
MSGLSLPTEEVVRAAVDELLAQHRAGGSYPSVSALAKRFHVNRTTFYRHYCAVTAAMLDTAAHQHTNGTQRRRPRREEDDRDRTIQRLRAENTDLRRHLDIYEEHIRMLTIENQGFRRQLEQAAGLADLNDRRTR